MKRIGTLLILLSVAALMVTSVANATKPPKDDETGGGHTPVTVCHKPGTPAEQELTFDDDALGQIQVNGHLGHGDTLGPCPVTPPPPHDECEDIPGDQPEGFDCTPEPPVECPNGDLNGELPGCEAIVTPPVDPPVDPPTPRCPPPNPNGSYGGKDGKPGNDECIADPVDPVLPPLVIGVAPSTPPSTQQPSQPTTKPSKPTTKPVISSTPPVVTSTSPQPDTQQPSKNSKPSKTAATTSTAETLPYTGLGLNLAFVLGLFLASLGAHLRWPGLLVGFRSGLHNLRK